MKTKTPIHEVLRRIRPLAASHKAEHLRNLIALEPARSVRRDELQAALRDIVERNLGRSGVERRKRRRVIAA